MVLPARHTAVVLLGCCMWAFAANAKSKPLVCEVQVFLQPMLLVKQNGSWERKAKWEPKLHRAKLEFECIKKYKRFELEAALQADFAETEYEELLEKAYLHMEIRKLLALTVGRFKSPFGAHINTPARMLWTVYRSRTSDHLSDDLLIGGYQTGAMVSGKMKSVGTHEYAVALFQYDASEVSGIDWQDFLAYPVLFLSYSPFKKLEFSYSLAMPRAAVSFISGKRKTHRMYLHDIAVRMRIRKWLQFFAEGFIGIDTTDVTAVRELVLAYDENVAYSIYAMECSEIDLTKKLTLRLSGGLEFLNGVNYVGLARQNRDYYFSGVLCAGVHFGKRLFAQVSYDNRYTNDFESIGMRRIAAQVAYDARLKMGKKAFSEDWFDKKMKKNKKKGKKSSKKKTGAIPDEPAGQKEKAETDSTDAAQVPAGEDQPEPPESERGSSPEREAEPAAATLPPKEPLPQTGSQSDSAASPQFPAEPTQPQLEPVHER